VKYILPPLISIILLAVLLLKVDASTVYRGFTSADPLLLIAAMFTSLFFNILLGADKTRRILKAMGCVLPLKTALFIRLGSSPLRLVFPLKTGELIQPVYYKKYHELPLGKGVSSLLFDKMLNLLGILFYLFLGTHFNKMNRPGSTVFLLILVPVIFFLSPRLLNLALRFIKRLHVKLYQVFYDLGSAFSETGTVAKLKLLLYGLFFQTSELIDAYLIFMAYKVSLSPLQILALIPLVKLIANIPITSSGIGTREAGVVLVFSRFAEEGLLMSIGISLTFIEYILPVLFGNPFLNAFLSRTLPSGQKGTA